MKNKYLSLITLFALHGGVANAEKGFFTCKSSSSGSTNCVLKKKVVANSTAIHKGESYHAQYDVNYNFSCFPGGYNSNIEINAGEPRTSKETLIYSDYQYANSYSRSITLLGKGPLVLHDSDPEGTLWDIFGPGCGLEIKFTMAPSTSQIRNWLAATQGVINEINLNVPLVETIAEIRTWYQANLIDPVTTAGFLKTQIDALRSLGASEADLKKADAFEAIIEGNPLEKVIEPLQPFLNDLIAAHKRGTALKEKLEFAKQKQDVIFTQAMDRALNTIERNR